MAKSETAQQRLVSMRQELGAAEQTLRSVKASEDQALANAKAYADWHAAIAAAQAEVSRLTRLVAKLTGLADAEAHARAADEQRTLEDDYNAAAERAAALIADNLRKLGELARETVAIIGQSEEMRIAAQAGRAKDAPPLVSAEQRARGAESLPRKVISDEVVDRWVFVETGMLLDAAMALQVHSSDGRTGDLSGGSMSSRVIRVEKRRFKKVVFHPAEKAQTSLPLVRTLSVPGITMSDPPAWLPLTGDSPGEILEALDRLTAERVRETRTELLPIEKAEAVAA